MNLAASSNDRHGVSNYQSIEYLFKSFFRLTTEKHKNSALLSICERNPPMTGGSPYKGTVMQKMYPSDDVIMNHECDCSFMSKSLLISAGTRGLWSIHDGMFTSLWHQVCMKRGRTRLSNCCYRRKTRGTSLDVIVKLVMLSDTTRSIFPWRFWPN